MKSEAVAVKVAASAPIECHFWSEETGWRGVCSELKIAVEGDNFEDSKKAMERALAEYLIAMLRERGAKIAA